MKRVVSLVAACLALPLATEARASHLPCGLPQGHPAWIEFADGSVPFRQRLFGRPGVVVATNGVERAAEMRSLGARTVYWHMNLRGLVGTPAAPKDPSILPEKVQSLYDRAVASSGCPTPVIGLNELWGARRQTPWPPETVRYRQNVLEVLRGLAAKGAVPVLLVPGRPGGPHTGGEAAAWWQEVGKAAHVVRQVHFNARLNYLQGPIVGSRLRRIAMRESVRPFLELGIPPERMGLLVGFQSGPGKGGREGLRPDAAWLEVVKREALAARHVTGELGLASIWSWGWGTFNAEGADPDKPRAACVWLWTRDPSLCDGPAVAGRRFDPSLAEGQIVLPAGAHCDTPLGAIPAAAVERLARATGDRRDALSALLARLVYARYGGPASAGDVRRAEAVVVERGFGSRGAYEAELAARGLDRGVAREILADHLRRQALEAELLVTLPGRYPPDWIAARYKAALRGAICDRDELPGPAPYDFGSLFHFLDLPPGSVTIAASRRAVRPGVAVVLRGRVRSVRARERVTVYARRDGRSSFWKAGTARVRADGRWTLRVVPVRKTLYRAVALSAASEAVAVRVRGRA